MRIRKKLEERLSKVLKSKIRRLRENESDEEDDVNNDPSNDRETDPELDKLIGVEPAESDVNSDVPSEPEVPSEPVQTNEPDDGDDANGIKRAKVKIFFDKLGKSPTLMNYLNFTSPHEQAEAIQQFAELVKVPRSQLLPLLKMIKNISQNDERGE